MAFGPLFPLFATANSFSWVGVDFMKETDCKKPDPTKILRKHPNEDVMSNWCGLCQTIHIYCTTDQIDHGLDHVSIYTDQIDHDIDHLGPYLPF